MHKLLQSRECEERNGYHDGGLRYDEVSASESITKKILSFNNLINDSTISLLATRRGALPVLDLLLVSDLGSSYTGHTCLRHDYCAFGI